MVSYGFLRFSYGFPMVLHHTNSGASNCPRDCLSARQRVFFNSLSYKDLLATATGSGTWDQLGPRWGRGGPPEGRSATAGEENSWCLGSHGWSKSPAVHGSWGRAGSYSRDTNGERASHRVFSSHGGYTAGIQLHKNVGILAESHRKPT